MSVRRVFHLANRKFRRLPPFALLFRWIRKVKPPSICFVAATRMAEDEFWTSSPLGTSLKPLLQNKVSCHIRYENTDGLPALYNKAIQEIKSDILVFLHDDVWLDDPQLLSKLATGLETFDIIGVAGNTRILKYQPAWIFSQIVYGKFIRDNDNLSGSIVHGEPPDNANKVTFGRSPAQCELLDGVLLAASRRTLLLSEVAFDNTFKFDFYDMDFCRKSRQSGLRLGTWPIDIIHKSRGKFGTERWQEGYKAYLAKWGH